MSHNLFNSLQEFRFSGKTGQYYSLPALEKAGLGKVSRLPVGLRVVLESASYGVAISKTGCPRHSISFQSGP